jgi:uncharacterized DUF497 family protein
VQVKWDEAKNRRNIQKHGIDFTDVEEMFSHPLLTLLDNRYDYGESRWISIGQLQALIVVVVYTERDEDVLRIISARKATRYEVRHYEQAIKN